VTTPTGAASAGPGTAIVTWTAAWDRDDPELTYRLYRDGSSTPVFTTTADSTPWQLPRINFTDSGLNAGPHSYLLRVTDSDGNIGSTGVALAINGDAGCAGGGTTYRGVSQPGTPKPTSESSLDHIGVGPSLAVDGSTIGTASSVALTNTEPHPWWQVDLQASMPDREGERLEPDRRRCGRRSA